MFQYMPDIAQKRRKSVKTTICYKLTIKSNYLELQYLNNT